MKEMTATEAQEILQVYQAWRRYHGMPGLGPDMPDPRKIGEALDIAIRILNSINHPHEGGVYYGG